MSLHRWFWKLLKKRYHPVRLEVMNFTYKVEQRNAELVVEISRSKSDGTWEVIEQLEPYTRYGVVEAAADGQLLRVISLQDYLILRFFKEITQSDGRAPMVIAPQKLTQSHITFLTLQSNVVVTPEASHLILDAQNGRLASGPADRAVSTTKRHREPERQPESLLKRPSTVYQDSVQHAFSTQPESSQDPLYARTGAVSGGSKQLPGRRFTLNPQKLTEIEEETAVVQQMLTPAESQSERDVARIYPAPGSTAEQQSIQEHKQTVSDSADGDPLNQSLSALSGLEPLSNSSTVIRCERIVIQGDAHFEQLKESLEKSGFEISRGSEGDFPICLCDDVGMLEVSALQEEQYSLDIVSPSEKLTTAIQELPRSAILEITIKYIPNNAAESDDSVKDSLPSEVVEEEGSSFTDDHVDGNPHEAPRLEESVDELDNTWITFGENLTTTQKNALKLIVAGCSVADLDEIARQAGSTTNLLIDSINELALELIDDNLINPVDSSYVVEEEYARAVRALLNRGNN